MSILWPHPPYAEDQPHTTAILTTHVLLRGFQLGAAVGPIAAPIRYRILRRAPSPPPFLPTLLHTTSSSAFVGTGILALALVGRMWGREDIEWKDRAWRLLENEGQVEVDTWSGVGMVGGAAATVGVGRRYGLVRGFRDVVGGAGLGGVAGVLGYVGWRYGIRGGERSG